MRFEEWKERVKENNKKGIPFFAEAAQAVEITESEETENESGTAKAEHGDS